MFLFYTAKRGVCIRVRTRRPNTTPPSSPPLVRLQSTAPFCTVKEGTLDRRFGDKERRRVGKVGTLCKPQRQRECGKTRLMSRTMALHVHYKTLYIYQPFSAKQQNNNVKSLHSAYLRQREYRRQIFHTYIGKWRLPLHIQLKIILTQLGRLNTSSHSRNL